jgi:integral membrane protein
MAAMTRALDLRSVAGWLRLVGLLEAVSWVGLLVGMYFKYVGSPSTEIGVKIFGPIHGGIFLAYVAVALVTARLLRWSAGTTLLALVASVPPMASIWFERRATRDGRLPQDAALTA